MPFWPEEIHSKGATLSTVAAIAVQHTSQRFSAKEAVLGSANQRPSKTALQRNIKRRQASDSSLLGKRGARDQLLEIRRADQLVGDLSHRDRGFARSVHGHEFLCALTLDAEPHVEEHIADLELDRPALEDQQSPKLQGQQGPF